MLHGNLMESGFWRSMCDLVISATAPNYKADCGKINYERPVCGSG